MQGRREDFWDEVAKKKECPREQGQTERFKPGWREKIKRQQQFEEENWETDKREKVGQISGIMRTLVCWKSNKIGLFCYHIAKVIAFGTEMTHGQIKLTSETTLLPFLGLGSFSLGLGFFLQKRKKAFRDSGSSFKKSAFRWVLHLFRHNQGLPCLLHYQAYYTHMCTMTNHLTDELTRTLSTQQRTAADWMWDTKALNANKARPAAFVITMWHCSLICKSFTFFPPYFKETTYSEV